MDIGASTPVGMSVILACALASCAREPDSLLVITVDAVPALSGIAVLQTSSMASGLSIGHVFTNAPSSLGGGTTTTFGIQVPSSISGPFSIHVEADDVVGNLLASGDGEITLAHGKRVDLLVTLGQSTVDLGESTVDLGESRDIGESTVDLSGSTADMGTPDHVCVVSIDTLDDGCTLAP